MEKIINEISDGSFYCDKCNCVGDANGGTEQEGNVALLGRTGDEEIDVAFGDWDTELTIEDKKILVRHYLSEAHSYFQSALGYAEELDYRFVQDCMDEAKSMVDYAEEKGANIGSFE